MAAGSYRDLLVWQQAMDLVEAVYELCRNLPKDETYGLVSQLRRAVVSIPSNIAEDSGRGAKEFKHHLRISYGSLCEVETQLLIVQRLHLINPQWDTLFVKVASVGRLLKKLSASLIPSETSVTSETLETSL